MKKCAYCTGLFEGRGRTCSDICRRKRIAEQQLEYKKRRYACDPDFRAKHKKEVADWKAANPTRVNEYLKRYQKKRYRRDPVYREKRKEYARNYSVARRAELKQSAENLRP
jgi:hypothetical protein